MPFLRHFLAANRTIEHASRELKWIKQELPPEKWASAARRRLRLEPLQYILGSQPFGELTILCRKNVLIPRWETEEWLNRVLDEIEDQERLTVVDVCSGTGCIPLTVKHRRPQDTVYGIDISPEAVDLCHENLALYNRQFDQVAKISFVHGDVFQRPSLEFEKVDILTANPPYIPQGEFSASVFHDGVLKSVKLYEPKLALVGDLEFYEALIENWVLQLRPVAFVFEVGGKHQVDFVLQRLQGIYDCGSMYDSQGKIRCVVGWTDNLRLRALCE